MKQLLILTIAVLAFSVSSCKQKHCWNCTITYKNSVQFPDIQGNPGSGVKLLQVCDKTKDDMEKFEADHKVDDAANNSSVIYDCVRDYYK